MERLIALPWSEDDQPDDLVETDSDDSASDKWAYRLTPQGGRTPSCGQHRRR